ncbi:Putative membrane spanning protein (plasmid) [Borrelia crocidurae DOU]|uniref:Putative membrane spanning protein n=1 Tax=Borrelia crocidurae DOU TaxID=1293575 RepID=W5SJZ6_9SPIR|nr:virulence associated lipoprotein [Borrelia crocidurae]AHH07449.1 Putative membrane spanning protein [Borrelia crocidurae DOU]
MKRKDFILFITFVFILISCLLVSCGAKKKYTPVSSAVRRNRVDLPLPKPQFGATSRPGNGGLNGGAGNDEQSLKQKEIASIKIPDKVLEILKTHANKNWNEDAEGYNLTGANQLFTRVKYQVGSREKFLYNDETNENRAKESKAARREFYLACEYNANFIKAFAGVVNRLVATDELAAKNKKRLEGLLENVRSYAIDYYNVYSLLKKKQNKLDVLTLKKLQSLKAEFLKLEKEQQELYDVIQLIINDYNNDTPINSSEPTHNLKSGDTLPSEIIQYWEEDRHYGEFSRKRGVLLDTASVVRKLLNDIY